MSAITLALYELKRLMRYRLATITFLFLPIVGVILKLVLKVSLIDWLTPAVCAVLTGTIFVIRWLIDSACGLANALRTTPVSELSLFTSRFVAVLVIVGLQSALYFLAVFVIVA